MNVLPVFWLVDLIKEEALPETSSFAAPNNQRLEDEAFLLGRQKGKLLVSGRM